ncbi:MAG: hypothetical protein J0647_01135 [Campylobacteraceae bacterium]|nr:hypothetical protein [Campylobacteraceae bacterium]
MAGGGDDGEMNPYISYVDLFSSVILVLLLFVLIMFVNVGYYMQFNSKESKQEVSPKNISSSTKEVNTTVTIQSSSPSEGNTLSKNTEQVADVEFKESDLMVIFKNNEYFLSKEMISIVSKAMDKVLKTRPNATFVISVGDSKKLISSTQTKQVSLGRILSLKNSLESVQTFKNKIKINYKTPEKTGFEFGYLKIDVK